LKKPFSLLTASSRMVLANFPKVKEFQVLEAPTGKKKGLIATWRDLPDLILFDPIWADTSDREFISKLRNDPRIILTPLVALSSDLARAPIAPLIFKETAAAIVKLRYPPR
jgi:hypothetical protein